MSDAVVTLVFTSGPRAGSRIELVQETTIGREAEIIISDEEASRRHATLRPVPDGVEVLDLGSLNGTTVDGDRLGDSPRLAGNGSTIKIGATTLSVEVPTPDAGATRVAQEATHDGATRVAEALPDDSDRTVMRARPQFEPFEATVVGRHQPIDPALATPAPAPAPPSAPPQAALEPTPAIESAPSVGPTPAVEPEPDVAEARPPKAPPPPVRALLGYLFGAGPEKIPARIAIVVVSYTILVVAITVLIYSLVS